MADLFYTGSATSSLNLDSNATVGTADTGDLRRKYNFGDKVSELALSQDPFFRFVSKVGKKPTDDPHFKFTEKRPSWMKRYAYVTAWSASNFAADGGTADEATVTSGIIDGAGDVIYLQLETDYLSEGNVQNIFGNAARVIGSSGTTPSFLLEGQLLKVPTHGNAAAETTANAFNTNDYFVGKIDSIVVDSSSTYSAVVKLTVVRGITAVANNDLAGWGATGTAEEPMSDLTTAQLKSLRIHDHLERARCYIVGNAHAEGTGYPETWKDQPFTTGTGVTQIWKTTMAMTNSARATVLRYEGNEWARIWKEKLIEHKYDIEQSLLFGSQSVSTSGGVNYTQGAVDYVINNGNIFSWSTSKTADDFLDDMSNYLDPRYNSSVGTVFFCSTEVYNWLHKLGGYFANNVEISSNFSADLAVSGRKKVLGLDSTNISTPYGSMNVVRNIHLDGTGVDMLGINLKYCNYRPLVGNGVNRDTSVYVGVQTLENSGVDRRVDLILTEGGMEWSMAESHAIWT